MTFSEPSETSKMEFSTKIVDCIQPLTIFAKHLILGVSQSYEYVSDKAKQNPGALHSTENQDCNLCKLLKFNFIFTLPCSETLLITNSIRLSLISTGFNHAVEYI